VVPRDGKCLLFEPALEHEVAEQEREACARQAVGGVTEACNETSQDNKGEPRIDDERGADTGTPGRQRRKDLRSIHGDQVAEDVRNQRHPRKQRQVAPLAVLPENEGQHDTGKQDPQRQQDKGMRDTAVPQGEENHRVDPGGDIIEVR